MVKSPEQLEAQLLTLPPADRARLAEGERRLAELRAGSVAGVPAAQVFARVPPRARRSHRTHRAR